MKKRTSSPLFILNIGKARITHLLLSFIVLLMLSCSTDTDFDEVQASRSEAVARESTNALIGPIFSLPITFHRVDLFTSTGNNLTGTITVQIRNADGTVIIGSTTVPASSIIKGNMIRNAFVFYPALTLSSGQKYRIYLIRSNPHNYLTDHIAWRTSSGGVDAYPKGVPNVFPSWVLDYSFVTYSNGYVDQQQTQTNYGFAVGNTSYLWQEFVPQYIWVVHP